MPVLPLDPDPDTEEISGLRAQVLGQGEQGPGVPGHLDVVVARQGCTVLEIGEPLAERRGRREEREERDRREAEGCLFILRAPYVRSPIIP